jgi:catechol 2,3-dioxygenase-like lactoylglutathione lyase family enzyme
VTVQLNHHIIPARDKHESAAFMAEVLGLDPPQRFGPFVVVELDNGLSLDFADNDGDFSRLHYAFLVSEQEFDEIFGRIQQRGLQFWADPSTNRPGEINHNDGGRGCYFLDPSGHFLEIFTRPYGSGS